MIYLFLRVFWVEPFPIGILVICVMHDLMSYNHNNVSMALTPPRRPVLCWELHYSIFVRIFKTLSLQTGALASG